jgi:hypothetical protein
MYGTKHASEEQQAGSELVVAALRQRLAGSDCAPSGTDEEQLAGFELVVAAL